MVNFRGKNQLNITKECVILGLLPLYHGYGCFLLLAAFLIGATFVVLPKFENGLFLSSIQNYKVSSIGKNKYINK